MKVGGACGRTTLVLPDSCTQRPTSNVTDMHQDTHGTRRRVRPANQSTSHCNGIIETDRQRTHAPVMYLRDVSCRNRLWAISTCCCCCCCCCSTIHCTRPVLFSLLFRTAYYFPDTFDTSCGWQVQLCKSLVNTCHIYLSEVNSTAKRFSK